MFDVVHDTRCVAVPPFGKDFEGIRHPPVGKLAVFPIDAGFFENLPVGRFDECFATLAATCYRLPEARMGRSLEQENIEIGRVNDDQH